MAKGPGKPTPHIERPAINPRHLRKMVADLALARKVAGEIKAAMAAATPDTTDDTAAPPRQHRLGKRLIEAEVKQRADAGERWDSITDLSLDLHEWMKTKTDKPLEPRTIENYLRGDLWSLISKK